MGASCISKTKKEPLMRTLITSLALLLGSCKLFLPDITSEEAGAECGDGIDNDGDTLTDCEESACLTALDCSIRCGDGFINQLSEECDSENLNEQSCTGFGFDTGILRCDPESCTFDIAGCETVPICGNHRIDSGEDCEGEDLGGQSCADFDFDEGQLQCDPSECSFDFSDCVITQICGDNIVEAPEECDDGDNTNGDGCDNNCTVTACQNGLFTIGELCYDDAEVSLASSGPRVVRSVDLNNNGLLDLVNTRVNNTIEVHLDPFAAVPGIVSTVSIGTGVNPFDFVLFDKDQDGDQDIAVISNANAKLALLSNNGAGSFVFSGEQNIATTPIALASGDVDGDSDNDLVIAYENFNIQVFLQTAGDFILSQTLTSGVSGVDTCKDVALADLDKDGGLEIIAPSQTQDKIAIYTRTAGTFGATPILLTVQGGPQSIFVGDFDNDTKLDISVASHVAQSATVLFGDGALGFAATAIVPNVTGASVINAKDVTKDGFLDLVVASSVGGLFVIKNNGGRVFGVPVIKGTSSPGVGLDLGDYNSDNAQDICIAEPAANKLGILFATP
jgi:cysteine-rich repeat protein